MPEEGKMKKLIFPSAVIAMLCLINYSAFAQTQTYTVTNSTGMTIKSVNISPNDANKWGFDLNTTGNVPDNYSFQFTQTVDRNNCLYDVRYMTEDGTYYYVQDVDLCNSTTFTIPKHEMRIDKK
jgi:hypothetical protein